MFNLRSAILSVGLLGVLAWLPSLAWSQDTVVKSSASARKQRLKIAADVDVSPAGLMARYPAGSIVTVQQADRAIAEVKAGRKQTEVRLKADEKACYGQFFANRCIAEANDRYRKSRTDIKPIQVEAERFKRHEAVAKRDKALEAKRSKEAGTPRSSVDTHAEKFEAKQQKRHQDERSATEKRAESEAAFAKKVSDREAARSNVLKKREKTALRRKKKAASAAAAAKRTAAAKSSASVASASATASAGK